MKKTGLIKHLGISGKVVSVGLTITALFAITTFAWIIPGAEKAILERKREKIKEATETAWSIMQYHQSLVDAKEMTLEEAQKRASSVIKNMRYGPEMKDYFWINDMRPYMIMHPYRPAMDGTSLEDFKDPNDVYLFVEAVKVCQKQGAGFVRYSWQWKDDASNIVPKISHVRLYRPWQWIVGTGMYIEDVRTEIHAWRIRVIIVTMLVALLGIFLSWRIGLEVSMRVKLLSQSDSDLLQGAGKVWRLQNLVMIIIVPALAFITVFWGARFYRNLTDIIIDGFDKKISAISSTTGCFIRGEDHDVIAKEATEDSALYKKYVLPMQRIRKKTGLTYLYTQVLSGERPFCNYILDASEGEDHSEIGYKDELPPADFQGAENVLIYGVSHVGGVEATEGWGLIKVSYSPIYKDDNTIASMAGADVNMSAIAAKTRTALFAIGLLAFCAMCGTGYVTFLFSTSFRKPITKLRDAALMIAGGSHDHQVTVTKPKEFIKLSAAFNNIGERLKNTLSELKTADNAITEGNIQHDIMLALDNPWTPETVDANPACRWLSSDAREKTSSGYISGKHHSMVWLGAPLPPLEALKLRCHTAAMMTKPANNKENPTEIITKITKETAPCCLVTGNDGATLIANSSIDVLVVDKKGKLNLASISKTTNLKDQDWSWLIISDAPTEIKEQADSSISKALNNDSPTPAIILDSIEESLKTSDRNNQLFVSVMEVTV